MFQSREVDLRTSDITRLGSMGMFMASQFPDPEGRVAAGCIDVVSLSPATARSSADACDGCPIVFGEWQTGGSNIGVRLVSWTPGTLHWHDRMRDDALPADEAGTFCWRTVL